MMTNQEEYMGPPSVPNSVASFLPATANMDQQVHRKTPSPLWGSGLAHAVTSRQIQC